MTPGALRQLMGLVDARKARELARLDGLLAEDRRLAAEIEALAATAARDQASGETLPPAQQGLRLAWADQRIGAIRQRRGELAAGIRAARAAAAVSLGKHRTLEHLVERAESAARQLRTARAEREAPPRVARLD